MENFLKIYEKLSGRVYNFSLSSLGNSADAKALGLAGKLGVVKAGARADLLIIEKNPFDGLETLRKSSIFSPLNYKPIL